MALSLDAIFKPLNDFFLKLFQTGTESGVVFRFDKFGSVISGQDFTDSNRAEERFSDLVNHIPSDSGDGVSVVFRQDAVDNAYFFRLLSPSQPCVAADDPNAQDVMGAFAAIKSNALKIWNNITLESSSGLMLQFKPSLAAPGNWHDESAAEIWTHYSFAVNAPAAPLPTPPKWPIWRLKLDDSTLRGVIGPRRFQVSDPILKAISENPVQPSPAAVVSPANVMVTEPALAPLRRPAMFERAGMPIARFAATPVEEVRLSPALAHATAETAAVQPAFRLHDKISLQLGAVDVSERFQLAQVIGTTAPTQSAVTDSISVDFEYCLVKISRPWYVDSFVADGSWCVPAVAKGSVSSGNVLTAFSMLPIAFVTIRNLVIEANWAASDLTSAAQATDFGPFKVDAGIVQNKLSHAGIQVVGWLLQTLSALPPNDSPQSDQAPDGSNG